VDGPVQSRLLDMGSVAAVRSESIYHAVAAAMRPNDDPVVVMLRPDSGYVGVGREEGAADGIDLEFCRRRGIPVIRRHVDGGAVLPAYRELGIPVSYTRDRGVRVAGKRIGDMGSGEIGDAFCFAGSMVYSFDAELASRVVRVASPEVEVTCMREHLDEPRQLDAIGEALARAIEACYRTELVPSMPTPDELDAIYVWDRRLVS
jgi:lipoate-protein ligase A